MSSAVAPESPSSSKYAPTIPARKMDELVCQFLTSGLTASEFARRNGLSEHQGARLSRLAAESARPSSEMREKAGQIVVNVSSGVLSTVEALAMKAKAALDAAALTWADGVMPDRETQKNIEWAARVLTLPLRFQRPPGKQDDVSPPALPASSGSISV